MSLKDSKPHFAFLVAAFIFGLSYLVITPPYQVPDESNHFYRIYQVSTGQFLPLKSDQRVGGLVPMFIGDMEAKFSNTSISWQNKVQVKDLKDVFNIPFLDTALVFKDFPHTAYYSPVSYIPQSLAMYVCRKLKTSAGTVFYSARLAAFLVWVLAMFYTIKVVPTGKWLFVVLALLPAHLSVATSLSADTMTNSLSFLLLAHVLKYAVSNTKLSRKDLFILFAIVLLLGLAKMMYVLLCTLLLAIPASVFSGKRQRFFSLSLIILPALIVSLMWSSRLSKYYIPWSEYHGGVKQWVTLHPAANYHLQKEYLMAEPWMAVSVVYKTLIHNPNFFFVSFIGNFGTYMDTPLPDWISLVAWLLVLYAAVVDTKSFPRAKLIFLSAFLLCTGALIIIQYLVWCEVRGENLLWLPGRYFIPFMPCLLFLLSFNFIKKTTHPLLVMSVLLFVNLFALILIQQRYF